MEIHTQNVLTMCSCLTQNVYSRMFKMTINPSTQSHESWRLVACDWPGAQL